jgi:anti-sigma factor RsiW
MTCEQTTELLGAYLDDDLATEVRQRVERHLLRCPGCAWEASSLRITQERLTGETEEVVASDSFRARTLSRLRTDNPHLTPDEVVTEDPLQYQLPIAL